MAPVIWVTLGVGGGGLGLWALLLIVTSRREGVGLTRRQLRDARRASDEQGRPRPQTGPRP
jgi:uncharacterized membrane protein YedE/YeeE